MSETGARGVRPGEDAPRGRLRTLAAHPAATPLGLLAAGLAGAAHLYGTNPHEPGSLLPRCPFNWATGLLCPGCGGTRMAYDLLHGDLVTAFHDNAALLAATPVLALLYLRWLGAGLRGRRNPPRLGGRGAAAVLVAAVVWGVVRNVV
ncbi:hypothetical protein GCM10027168_02260 [Streptomyces capparidis]